MTSMSLLVEVTDFAHYAFVTHLNSKIIGQNLTMALEFICLNRISRCSYFYSLMKIELPNFR